jgi:hypothetical protein
VGEQVEAGTVCVSSGITTDGTYILEITYGPDLAFHLDRAAALDYVAYLTEVAQRAVYDLAIFAQLQSLGIPKQDAGVIVVNDIRPARPPLPDDRWPLSFHPLAAVRGVASVVMLLNGEPFGQWSVADVRQHAGHVLGVLAGVTLDNGYHRFLTGTLNLDDGRARAVVFHLSEFLEAAEKEDPRS